MHGCSPRRHRAWRPGPGDPASDLPPAGGSRPVGDRGRLEAWAKEVGWEILLNRAGTTFRGLPEKDKEGLGEKKAVALMLAQPSMIKRPVLDAGGKLLVGFKPEQYEEALD